MLEIEFMEGCIYLSLMTISGVFFVKSCCTGRVKNEILKGGQTKMLRGRVRGRVIYMDNKVTMNSRERLMSKDDYKKEA